MYTEVKQNRSRRLWRGVGRWIEGTQNGAKLWRTFIGRHAIERLWISSLEHGNKTTVHHLASCHSQETKNSVKLSGIIVHQS